MTTSLGNSFVDSFLEPLKQQYNDVTCSHKNKKVVTSVKVIFGIVDYICSVQFILKLKQSAMVSRRFD